MEQDFKPEENQPGLFDSYIEYTEASQGSRFLNYLIDNLFMRFALSYVTGYLLGYLLAFIAPDFLSDNMVTNGDIILLSLILAYFNHFIYYTFCEFAFKGYTLGKLITGTKAIREDGNPLTLKDAVIRSLSRLVPFEQLSGFFSGRLWHDSWSKTMVIKAR